MTPKEIVDSLGLNIQGYAGYDTLENRTDTLDVFSAWIHGRIKKKIDDLNSQFKNWAMLPDLVQIAPIHQKIIETLQIILKKVHIKMKMGFVISTQMKLRKIQKCLKVIIIN